MRSLAIGLGFRAMPSLPLPLPLFQISRGRANIVLVFPVWPTQPWFPVLLELVCDFRLILKPTSSPLVSPHGIPHPLLSTGSLQLAAWKLSLNPSIFKDFRSHWSTFSWPAIVRPLTYLTGRLGDIGLICAFEGMKIPCRPH